MDSRTYRFIYSVKTNSDIPADFPKEIRERRFEAGVFLPQDDSNWYTRPPKFPARLLLLEEQSLWIVPHPTSGQSEVEIPLSDLTQLETGYILLLGWIKFTTRDSVHELIYNTRASRPLEHFLALLRNRWLPDELTSNLEQSPTILGDDLDIKFRNALHFELDTAERILFQYFQAPARVERRFVLLKRVTCLPGHLVLLTSANRISWITDVYKRYRDPYAVISRSAPLQALKSCGLEVFSEQVHLAVSFQTGDTWRVPVRGAPDDASAFSQALQERVSRLRTPQAASKHGP